MRVNSNTILTALSLLIAALLAACGSQATTTDTVLGDPDSGETNAPGVISGESPQQLSELFGTAGYAIIEDTNALLELVNDARCEAGLNPLEADLLLDATGELHSLDMGFNAYFAHIGLDGSTPGDRITRQGYAWGTYGENIAAGYTTIQAAFSGWMNSPGHRANILHPDFRDMGLGHVTVSGSPYNHYYTQLFGTLFSERDTPVTVTCP